MGSPPGTAHDSPPVHSSTGMTATLARSPRTRLNGGALPNVVAGLLAALVTLSYSISYGALIFSSSGLQPSLPLGMHAALMAAWIIALVVALGSSFHFSIAGPDSNATAILAIMAAAITERLTREGASSAQIGATVLAMLAVTAMLTGASVLALGAIRRGRLVRFLPYPVVGGFLAGTGWLILSGGVKVFCGRSLDLELFKAFPEPPATVWVSMGIVAAGLFIIPRFIRHFMVMPIVIVAGIAAFFIGLKISGIGIEQARTDGFLFKSVNSGGGMAEFYSSFSLVRWDAILSQWQNFLAMTIVVIITILLNATGLDLATDHDVDFDRELRINGLANLFCGLAGGMIGYLSVSRSLLNFKAGAGSRAAGLVTAAVCFGATFIFSSAVSWFPRPVLAGLVIFLGLSMLREWLWDTFSKLPLRDYGLIALILLLIALQGLIVGVAFGLLVASIFFVYSYSQTNCIKHSFSCGSPFSNKERSLEQITALRQKGEQARTLALQGYIFFGTSNAVLEYCRELIAREKLKFLLLDFRMVQGLDASAVLSFVKLQHICLKGGIQLLLSGLRPALLTVLEQAKFLPDDKIKVLSDMDRGLECIEDDLLAEGGASLDARTASQVQLARQESSESRVFGTAIIAEMDLRRLLSKQFEKATLDVLISYCETLKLQEGSLLFRRGDAGDSLYFIERGQVSVLLPLDDGHQKRLRSFGPGTIVGEMGLYSKLPRSADVVADRPCRVRKLSDESLTKLEREHPEVAIQFHTFVVRLLSSRLAAANEEIRALL